MARLPGVDRGDTKQDEFAPKSSFLEAVTYDRKNQTLDITFKSGSTHRYFSVFPSTYDAFRRAPDHGSFYARAIKGNLESSPIESKSIGRQQSTALKKVVQRRVLDAGVKRIAGTVNRAFGPRL